MVDAAPTEAAQEERANAVKVAAKAKLTKAQELRQKLKAFKKRGA